MIKIYMFVRSMLAPVILMIMTAGSVYAATVALPANDSLAAAGAWANVPYSYGDDGLYTTGTGAANGNNNYRVGLEDCADTAGKQISSVIIYLTGYSGRARAKVQLVPYFGAAAGTASGSMNFGTVEVTRSFDITGQRSPWTWGDLADLSVQFRPRTATLFSVDHIYAVVTYRDTTAAGQGHYFVFDAIASPETLGVAFPVVIRAMAAPGDTVMTSYGGGASLSDWTGSATPTVVHFSAGVCSAMVAIAQDTAATALIVSDGDTTGVSNTFAVVNGGLFRFWIAPIGPQTPGVPFPVSVSALDFYGDTASAFAERVGLWDATGSLTPDSSGLFSAGVWTGSVTVASAFVSDTVFCARAIGGRTYAGASNGFGVALGVSGEPGPAASRPGLRVMAYPNPVRGELGLDISVPSSGPLTVSLYNILGQMQLRKEMGVIPAGLTRVTMALPAGYKPGVYLVEAALGERLRQVQKVIIVR